MKRIFLLLATVSLALISCVEDNLAPDQAAEGTVTIKAVAADTKTTLNDRAVVWENSDKFKVVYHSFDQSADFSVKGSVNGATANFTGTVNPEWALKEKVHPYAVYPATAVTEVTGITTISHTLPEVQTGTITSGMNLSSAVLSEEDLAAGNAEAVFHNALTLLQIVVPEGVASVELSANYGLVGTSTFYVHEQDGTAENTGDYDDEDNPLYADVKATGKLTVKSFSNKKTVTLQNGDALDATKTHSVLVYPGNTPLALTMTGTDGATYSSSIDYVTLLAGECRLIDLTKIFGVTAKSEYVVFPAGGTVEIPVATVNDYTVSLSDGADSWISYSVPSKAFHSETIVFTVKPNEGGSREATVTISSNGKTTSFKISQKEIYMDFVYTEENPIEWQETFGVYSDREKALAGTDPTSFENLFRISLSTDFSKGTYEISGMFGFKNIYGASVAPTYYANYEDGVLTVTQNRDGFYFQSDIVFEYDKETKTFTMTDPVEIIARFDIFGWQNKEGFIYGYTATVKAEEPEEPETPEDTDPIVGEWTLTAGTMGETGSSWGDNPISLAGKTMVISGSDGNYVVEIAELSYNKTMTLSNNVLSSTPAYPDAPVLTLTYDAATQTLTQTGGEFMDYTSNPLKDIVATKGGAVELASSWNQSADLEIGWSMYSLSPTITIAVEGTTVTIKDFIYAGTTAVGTIDGNVITLPTTTMIYNTGKLDVELNLTISEDLKTITADTFTAGDAYLTVKNWKATAN